MKRNILSALLAAVLLVTALLCPLPAGAADREILTEPVDLSTVKQNARGSGYEWANRTNIMTFDHLYLETDAEYGFRIPENATLVLKGDNYISASRIALTAIGTLTVQGSGTLHLVAGEVGLKMMSVDKTASLKFNSGRITIDAGTTGVYSEYPAVIFGGTTDLTVNITDADGKAINGATVQINNGRLTANAPIFSPGSLSVASCDLTVNAKTAALEAPTVKIKENNVIRAGSSAETLKDVTEYGGETSILLIPTRTQKTSLILSALFDVEAPRFLDYLIFAFVILLFAAAVGLPILHQYRKDQKKKAELEEKRAAALAEKKKRKNAEKAE